MLHHPDHIRLVQELHGLPDAPKHEELYQYPILGKILSEVKINKDVKTIGVLINQVPENFQGYVEAFFNWGINSLGEFLTNFGNLIGQLLHPQNLQELLQRVFTIFGGSPADAINAALELFALLINAMVDNGIFAFFKNWLAGLRDLLGMMAKFLAVKLQNTVINLISPYLVTIFNLLFSAQRVRNQNVLRHFTTMFKAFKTNYAQSVILKDQGYVPLWIVLEQDIVKKMDLDRFKDLMVTLAWRTFYLTDIVFFYGSFENLQKKNTAFINTVGDIINEWGLWGRMMIEDSGSTFTTGYSIATLLSLINDKSLRQLMEIRYTPSSTSEFDILIDVMHDYSKQSIANLNEVLKPLYDLSLSIIKVSLLEKGDITQKEYEFPNPDLVSMVDIKDNFPDIVATKNARYLAAAYGTLQWELNALVYDYPLTTVTKMYDPINGRRAFLSIIGIEDEYFQILGGLVNLQLSALKDTSSKKRRLIGAKKQKAITGPSSSLPPPEYHLPKATDVTEAYVAQQLLEEVLAHHDPIIEAHVKKELWSNIDYNFDHTSSDDFITPLEFAEHLQATFLESSSSFNELSFFTMVIKFFKWSEALFHNMNDTTLRTFYVNGYSILHRTVDQINKLALMAYRLSNIHYESSKVDFPFYQQYYEYLLAQWEIECTRNPFFRSILVYSSITDVQSSEGLDKSDFIKHQAELACSAFGNLIFAFLKKQIIDLDTVLGLSQLTKHKIDLPFYDVDYINPHTNFLTQRSYIHVLVSNRIMNAFAERAANNFRISQDLFNTTQELIYKTTEIEAQLELTKQVTKQVNFAKYGIAALAVGGLAYYLYSDPPELYTRGLLDVPLIPINEVVATYSNDTLTNVTSAVEKNALVYARELKLELENPAFLAEVKDFLNATGNIYDGYKDVGFGEFHTAAKNAESVITANPQMDLFDKLREYAAAVKTTIFDTISNDSIVNERLKYKYEATQTLIGRYTGSNRKETVNQFFSNGVQLINKIENYMKLRSGLDRIGAIVKQTASTVDQVFNLFQFVTNIVKEYFAVLFGKYMGPGLWNQFFPFLAKSTIGVACISTLVAVTSPITRLLPTSLGGVDFSVFTKGLDASMKRIRLVLSKSKNDENGTVQLHEAAEFARTIFTNIVNIIGYENVRYLVINLILVLLSFGAQSSVYFIQSVVKVAMTYLDSMKFWFWTGIGSFTAISFLGGGAVISAFVAPIASFVTGKALSFAETLVKLPFQAQAAFRDQLSDSKSIINLFRKNVSNFQAQLTANQVGMTEQNVIELKNMTKNFYRALNEQYERTGDANDSQIIDIYSKRYLYLNAYNKIMYNLLAYIDSVVTLAYVGALPHYSSLPNFISFLDRSIPFLERDPRYYVDVINEYTVPQSVENKDTVIKLNQPISEVFYSQNKQEIPLLKDDSLKYLISSENW